MASNKAEAAAAAPPRALTLHRAYRGKIQMMAKAPLRSYGDLALWYTPGVADASRAIARNPDDVYELTNRANTIAIISDGSRVLGLGDIGPEAGLPVMEGKALLFKHFGGIDAVPLCIRPQAPQEIAAFARAIAPSVGAINLEDISAPKCFRLLDDLRGNCEVPVWHDDQQGTATVVLAALLNALEVTGKRMDSVRIALIGIGAANMAVYRLLRAEGLSGEQFIACDSRGILHRGRADISHARDTFQEKWQVCEETNPETITGGIAEALRGADVCIAFSQPGPETIPAQAVSGMAARAIVFACANPVPEILPEAAKAAGVAIIATGRSDFPNQVNNCLAFPGVFRGVLDVRARRISDGMARAAAHALMQCGRRAGLSETALLPRADEIDVAASVAAATGVAACREGAARIVLDADNLFNQAVTAITAARKAMDALIDGGCIAPLPD
ncbi:NADP-dependent malic enzyme [Breoghania sp. L-A4]|uniref:NAD(P)-dependent malic enzyme n=1 Tax=Breoghania sp. L-A4 TaxID=2304600 RepID=UPI000E35ACAD|nr:NADP-dependent malic enzyme [Breoghania sp. L-A4]AXS41697.1 NADP-dependent malic enzyme [Breoghania sp. L-A4]